MENRAGYWRSNLSGEAEYKSFVPAPLPPEPNYFLETEIVQALIRAKQSLTSLDAIAKRIPNLDLYMSMYVRKEALMSSQIEGTQASLEDVLDPTIDKNQNRNVRDVVNYIQATEYAIKRLDTLPLCNRLIKEAHAVLMDGVRAQEKNPGEFRYSQNWIGGQGSKLKDAHFIPPNPEDMKIAMSDLETFMNLSAALDPLIQIALIHYQFETIHPFLDGNGRIGRLLITLFLIEKKVLSSPSLYLSYYLKSNRIEYYDRLTEVRVKGNYEQWVMFFLHAIERSALDGIETIDQLVVLHEKNENLIVKMGRASLNTMNLFTYLESNPIIEISKTAKDVNVSYNTVSSAVERLLQVGILAQSDDSRRNRTYYYKEYLDILRAGT